MVDKGLDALGKRRVPSGAIVSNGLNYCGYDGFTQGPPKRRVARRSDRKTGTAEYYEIMLG